VGEDNRLAYVAVVAVEGYRAPVVDIDLRALPDALAIISERICSSLDGALIGRVSASTIEIRFLLRPGENADERLLQLAAAIESPVPARGGDVLFKATIGYAAWPWQNSRLSRVMANAELALAKARAAHLKLATFTDNDRAEAEARRNLASDLSKALARNEFSLRYQPKLNLRSGRILAASDDLATF
jgi:predicted signal transduction protein with EAL and GGDEF domain